MASKLDDDLVGQRLTEEDLRRTDESQLTTFEWQALDLVREIYSAGTRSFIRAVGVSDRLLEELIGIRSEFEANSLGGQKARELGEAGEFEGFFLVGVALGSQIRVDEPNLAGLIERGQATTGVGGPFSVGFIDGEVSSGLHEGAASQALIPLVSANRAFEGWVYADAKRSLFPPGSSNQTLLVATPPGFSPTGLLNIARVLLCSDERGFARPLSKGSQDARAGGTIVAREWLAAGLWLGIWLRARQRELGVVSGLREIPDSESAEDSYSPSNTVYQLACGWEYGQSFGSVLIKVRKDREWVTLPNRSKRPTLVDDELAEYFLARLQVQISIYSCQATGDFTWWPVHSFLRKGDIVLIRLAPFPRISREEMKHWFPRETFEQLILEGGASLLPDQAPPLLGLDRDWSDRDLRVEAERLWRDVPYLKWLIPETPEPGVVNDGLDGLGVITSDAVWKDGVWQATVGMVRPFAKSVRFDAISKAVRETHLPFFPETWRPGDFNPSSLTMLANLQFLPERTQLDERELSSILRVASSNGNTYASPNRWLRGQAGHRGIQEPPHALAIDLERLKLVRENLRRGRRIEEMADISPWPLDGTWLRKSIDSLFPGRLRLPDRPELSTYPCWELWGDQRGNLAWLSNGTPMELLDPQERSRGDHPAVGARRILDFLAQAGSVWPDPPRAVLLAVPDDGQAPPLDLALTMASGSSGVQLGDSGQVVLEARCDSRGTDGFRVLGSGYWEVDPEGIWTRPGSEWEIEIRPGGHLAGSRGPTFPLFVIGTEAVTSVIDIESASAQIARSFDKGRHQTLRRVKP